MQTRADAVHVGDDALVDSVIRLGRAMVDVAEASLVEVAGDVTGAQCRTLVVLAREGPCRPADLAATLAVSPSTATRMCDRLVRKGLVERMRDGIDRREVNLALTKAGRRLVDAVIDQRRRQVRSMLDTLPEGLRSALAAGLARLADAGTLPADHEPHWTPAGHGSPAGKR